MCGAAASQRLCPLLLGSRRCLFLSPPPCLRLAGMGEKAWVPGRLSSPSHWLGAAEVVAKACVGLCVCMCPRVRAYTHVYRGGSSNGREGM